MGLGVGAGLAIAGGLSGLGSVLGGLASSTGDYEMFPPPLGWRARRQWMGPLASQLGKLAMGEGGFGKGYMGRAFQQAHSMLAPAMREANKSLNFAQMRRGIYDSGVAQQQQAALQGGFLNALSRSAMDIVLQNEVRRRMEMMQAMQMLMGGITPGGTVQTPGGMSDAGVIAQGTLGTLGDMMALYSLGNMFGGANVGGDRYGAANPMRTFGPGLGPQYANYGAVGG